MRAATDAGEHNDGIVMIAYIANRSSGDGDMYVTMVSPSAHQCIS